MARSASLKHQIIKPKGFSAESPRENYTKGRFVDEPQATLSFGNKCGLDVSYCRLLLKTVA